MPFEPVIPEPPLKTCLSRLETEDLGDASREREQITAFIVAQANPPTDSLAGLGEAERDAALCRFEAVRRRLQHGVTLTEVALPCPHN